MTKPRSSIFDSADPATTLDLDGFAPKRGPDPRAPSVEALRQVAEAANFPSREAKGSAKPARTGRRYTTGRNVQFNIKASQETIDAFIRIADRQGWVLGETLEHAVAALQREHGAG